MQLMRDIRESIKKDNFPEFVCSFMNRMYPDRTFPDWVLEALASVNIFLCETQYSNGKEQYPLRTEQEGNLSTGDCGSSEIK